MKKELILNSILLAVTILLFLYTTTLVCEAIFDPEASLLKAITAMVVAAILVIPAIGKTKNVAERYVRRNKNPYHYE